MSDDIVDVIDALIDEQLEAGEAGMAARAATHTRMCPHCATREWHGLAVTERIEEMRRQYRAEQENRYYRNLFGLGDVELDYAESAILDGYRYADDTSPIVCPGSEFIGPLTVEQTRRAHRGIYMCCCAVCWTDRRSRSHPNWFDHGGPLLRSQPRWWRIDVTTLPAGVVIERVLDEHRQYLSVRESGARDGVAVTLYRDANGVQAFERRDADRRLLVLDVHCARPDSCGGRIVWHEIDGPGGDYEHSRSVVPVVWLGEVLAAAGLAEWFRYRHVRQRFIVAPRFASGGLVTRPVDWQIPDDPFDPSGWRDLGFLSGEVQFAHVDPDPVVDAFQRLRDRFRDMAGAVVGLGQRINATFTDEAFIPAPPPTAPVLDRRLSRAERRRRADQRAQDHTPPMWTTRMDGRRR